MSIPRWLDWAQRLQSIAQTGLHYDAHPFDRLRYEDVLEIAAEMMAAGGGTEISVVKDLLMQDKGHTTPKIDVRGAIFKDDKILLVQEKMDHYRWTLPGGWADIGESAGDSVVREIYEESGYYARAVKLLALYDRNKHDHPPYPFHAYKAFFRCELISEVRDPDPRNIETAGVEFFAEDDLPELSVGRVTADQIKRFFAHLRQPDLPTDFD